MSSIDWLGKVNPSWGYAPLFTLGDPKKKPNKGMLESNLLSLSYGRIIRRDIESSDGLVPASYETYQIVEPGDTVLRFTDLQNDQRSLRSGLVEERGIITSAYLSFTPDRRRLNPAFFAHMMRAVDLSKVFYRMGSGVRQSLNWSEFSLMRLPLPPLETQQRIADYLDRETAEIDAAVADLDRYVELLEKRRRAKITFAVEGKSNLVKDNSTESHPVANLGLVAHAYQPETLSMEALNQSGTFPVFGANGIIGRHDNFNHEQPQVVIACRGNTCGAVNWTLPKSWINGNAMVINPHAEKLRKDFLFYVLEIADYSLVITGSAQPQIIRESLYRLRVPLPPLETQRRIADYLDRETTEIDSLIADSTRLRDLLLKRRSVLITEVVTGRKQV